MKHRCKQCRKAFTAESRHRKFCSLDCCWEWRRRGRRPGQFRRGAKPWNDGTKGVMKRNKGSFVKGQESARTLPVGSVRIRTRRRDGRQRAWIKIAENGQPQDWRLRAAVVWEAANGRIAEGWVVHHRDGDALNDALENLEAVSRADHLRRHRADIERRSNRAAV